MEKESNITNLIFLALVLFGLILLACLINPFRKDKEQDIKNPPLKNATDLATLTPSSKINNLKTDDRFISSMGDFSLDLFKRSVKDKSVKNKMNSLVSPTSVMLALSMTANGADNNTLKEMENLLGQEISLDDLNAYLKYYVDNLPSNDKSKLNLANSIWFRDEADRLNVEADFLQTNADYYQASIFKAPFDKSTVDDINSWVSKKTDDMIKEMVEDIDDDSVMFLINALMFDGEWAKIYNESDVYDGVFKNIEGQDEEVSFMRSEEYSYVEDDRATGFLKPYANNDYSFLAILPKDGVSLADYIDSLNGQSFLDLIDKAESGMVYASMPKFSYDYEIILNDVLKSMGLVDGFDSTRADFSRLGHSTKGNIFIDQVLHKTYISVDERGTRAGAATSVEMKDESAPMDPKLVELNRPFLYAIIDNSTNLPIFLGSVNTVK